MNRKSLVSFLILLVYFVNESIGQDISPEPLEPVTDPNESGENTTIQTSTENAKCFTYWRRLFYGRRCYYCCTAPKDSFYCYCDVVSKQYCFAQKTETTLPQIGCTWNIQEIC